jgi:hypothetical protein
MADCLYLIGRQEDARNLFEHLLDLRNDLGLLAEEYDTKARRQVGNFPQAFSHVSLVNAAFNLSGYPSLSAMDDQRRAEVARLMRQSLWKRPWRSNSHSTRHRARKHLGRASS